MQHAQTVPLESSNPPLVDLMNRYRIQIVQLLAPAPDRGDELRLLQHL